MRNCTDFGRNSPERASERETVMSTLAARQNALAEGPTPADRIGLLVRLLGLSGHDQDSALRTLSRRYPFTRDQLHYAWRKASDWKRSFGIAVESMFVTELARQIAALEAEYDHARALLAATGGGGADELATVVEDLERARRTLAAAKSQASSATRNAPARCTPRSRS